MLIVTLPQSAAKNPIAFARRAKKSGADMLEIRGDLTPDVQCIDSPLPFLISPRGTGMRLIERFSPLYVDLEMSECLLIALLPKRTKLILSMHDYKRTPTEVQMKKIVQKMCSLKPWMIKIASNIKQDQDMIRLWNMQDFLNKKSIRSTVLGMGNQAHLLRLTSPIRNTFTYSYLDGTEPSAPGQLSLSLYALLPHVTRYTKKPSLYGIIGGMQITRSLSPVIHNALFKRHKIHAVYSCFPTDDFVETIKLLRKLGVKGLSVTAPFKTAAFQIAKKRDALVLQLNVANTLVWKSRTHWQAFNTDVFGIELGYPELKRAQSIAILGAGGAVPSVILAIRHANPTAQITVFARDPKKAKEVLQQCSVFIEPLASAALHTVDVSICAMSEDAVFPIPKAKRANQSLAIDLRYGKSTAFLLDAAKVGYRVRNGLSMLIHQALKQFEYFTGELPYKDDALYLRTILRSLDSRF